MKTTLLFVTALSIIFFHNSCVHKYSQDLNLDFEKKDQQTNKILSWMLFENPCYKVEIDSTIAYRGVNSLSIENINPKGKCITSGYACIVVDSFPEGQNLKISGYIKTENTSSDSLGLFISYNSDEYLFKISKNENLVGTNDWKEYFIDLNIKKGYRNLQFGIILFGEGKIWVDNLKLFIGSKQVKNLPTPINFVANRREIKWLKKHSIPIKTVQAENGFNDLEPLVQIIGKARIVALGENTHGTSEIFKMKHRLVEFLSTKMGYTIFSIEASMPEAYKLNDYVLNGVGDPKKLLKGMYFWTWNTQEVLDMIEWMREFNLSGKGIVQFTGFDMQYHQGAVENIRKFSEKNDAILTSKVDSISELFVELKSKGAQRTESKKEIAHIKDKCEHLLLYMAENKENITEILSDSEYRWLVQNANILLQQILTIYHNEDLEQRDRYLAENVEWILENNPNSKVVLWAHNNHISRKKGTMGSFLSEIYPNEYYNIGFLSNSGLYTARTFDSGKLNSKNVLDESKPGSFEYSFHKTGFPYFFFDFNQVNEIESKSKWLTKKLNYRDIGAVAYQIQFSPIRIYDLYNAVIFIDSTNASNCFDIQ